MHHAIVELRISTDTVVFQTGGPDSWALIRLSTMPIVPANASILIANEPGQWTEHRCDLEASQVTALLDTLTELKQFSTDLDIASSVDTSDVHHGLTITVTPHHPVQASRVWCVNAQATGVTGADASKLHRFLERLSALHPTVSRNPYAPFYPNE